MPQGRTFEPFPIDYISLPIGEVRVFDYVLKPAEMNALYFQMVLEYLCWWQRLRRWVWLTWLILIGKIKWGGY